MIEGGAKERDVHFSNSDSTAFLIKQNTVQETKKNALMDHTQLAPASYLPTVLPRLVSAKIL